MSELTFEAKLRAASRARGDPVQAEIEVLPEIDPNAPVVEGVIVDEVPGDLPR